MSLTVPAIREVAPTRRPRPLPAWASGRAIHFGLTLLRAQGWATAELMRDAGLDDAAVNDPEARLPHARVRAFWREAVRLTGDRALGLHVAGRVRPAAFDALGYVFRFSRTLGDGLERLARYHRFVDDLLTLVVETTRGEARVCLDGIDRLTRQTAEFMLATLTRAARTETGRRDLDPLAVEFAFARPRDTADYGRFFRAPLRFGAPRNCLVLAPDALRLPLIHAEAELREVLERRVRDVIARLPPLDGLVTRARFRLSEQLPGHPTAAAVGRQLGMSARSLHRRLREEGTTLRRLLDTLRRDLAERHLARGASIDETAFLLGYSEASAFQRAFRRWTGLTPATFRRRHRDTGGRAIVAPGASPAQPGTDGHGVRRGRRR